LSTRVKASECRPRVRAGSCKPLRRVLGLRQERGSSNDVVPLAKRGASSAKYAPAPLLTPATSILLTCRTQHRDALQVCGSHLRVLSLQARLPVCSPIVGLPGKSLPQLYTPRHVGRPMVETAVKNLARVRRQTQAPQLQPTSASCVRFDDRTRVPCCQASPLESRLPAHSRRRPSRGP